MAVDAQIVVDELQTLRSSPESERFMRTATVASHLESLLADHACLRDAAERLSSVADAMGCDALLGASALGNRLAGAAIAKAANGLSAYDTKSPARHVLIVDGMFVTGSQLDRAARFVSETSAAKVSGAVLLSAVDDPVMVVDGDRVVNVVGV